MRAPSLTLAAAFLIQVGCEPEKPPLSPPPSPRPSRPAEATAKPQNPLTSLRGGTSIPQHQGVIYERGSFSTIMRGPDGLVPIQADSGLSADQREEVKHLIQAAKNGQLDRRQALDAISTFTNSPSSELGTLVMALLGHSDTEVRGRALALLEGLTAPSLSSVAIAGLRDREASVRLQAAELATRLSAASLQPALEACFADTDKNVRQVAFEAALQQSPSSRLALLKAAVTAPAQDLALSALGTLEAEPSKPHAPLFMAALNHPDPFIRTKAHDILALTLNRNFKTTEEALNWWAKHSNCFDNDMVQVKDIPPEL
jgi:hypothetical protein